MVVLSSIGWKTASACYFQLKNEHTFSGAVKADAEKMGQAFVKGYYETYVKYTYPALLKIMGGSINMVTVLINTSNSLKAKGMSFNWITFDNPSAIVKSSNELQCIIVQHTDIKMAKGGVVTTSALIAISQDNGAHWTFMDTSNRSIETLKRVFPNLSSSLKLPAPKAAINY